MRDLFTQDIYIHERCNKSAILKLREKLLHLMPAKEAIHMKTPCLFPAHQQVAPTPAGTSPWCNSLLRYWRLLLEVF